MGHRGANGHPEIGATRFGGAPGSDINFLTGPRIEGKEQSSAIVYGFLGFLNNESVSANSMILPPYIIAMLWQVSHITEMSC